MAESTQRLSAEIKAAHPEVEWRRLAAFRNVVTHEYLGIDIDRTWAAVQISVPLLKEQAQAMLHELLAGNGE